jgi:hypothetical protein
MQQSMRSIPLLLVLALFVTAAHAQAVFRSVMPDGKIVYGDKPAPGAKESKQVNLVPLNISTPTQPSQGGADAPPPGGNNASNNAEVAAAQRNLEAAQKALAAGSEQQEGDRIGVAKGGGASSRLTDAYLQRVKALEDAVAAAQQQLDAAQRNAAH